MKSKMTTNSQLSTIEPKKQKQTNKKLSDQLEQEQDYRKGDHMEGYQRGGGERRMEEKVLTQETPEMNGVCRT